MGTMSGMSAHNATSGARLPAPEPSLSANIYCAGRLDEVIYRAIAPFWQSVRASAPERAYLRLLRYTRRGEHLKVRIHAPEALTAGLRASLEAAVLPCLDATAPAAQGRPLAAAPPIDAEDEAAELQPDRSFVWTHCRRSHVEFGGKPLLDEDAYVGGMVLCQSEASERVLAALKPDAEGNVPFRVRQNTLLKAVMSGVAALPWSPEQRRGYFGYHRDWLVRFSLAQGNQGPEKATESIARFDANLARLGPGLEAYRKAAESQWARSGEGAPPREEADGLWQEAVRTLHGVVAPFARNPAYRVDPFAPELMYSALFKVLHTLGNQLGLKPADEAFAHHLLLHVAGGHEGHGFAHDPPAP